MQQVFRFGGCKIESRKASKYSDDGLPRPKAELEIYKTAEGS
jgi:hypothetical protein